MGEVSRSGIYAEGCLGGLSGAQINIDCDAAQWHYSAMDICPGCGLDRDSLGGWKDFWHFIKDSDPSLGFFRPICLEGRDPREFFGEETLVVLDAMGAALARKFTETLESINAGTV